MKAFPGGKGAPGAAQRIVSEMPAHALYIEAFAGSAAVGRLKRRAAHEIYIDRDGETAGTLRKAMPDPRVAVVCGDAMRLLVPGRIPASAVLYADPPYLGSVRADANRRYYRHEVRTDAEHERFLAWVLSLPCRVLVSGYYSTLYEHRLTGWRRVDFTVATRGGQAVESLWMNYPPPLELHDTRHVGVNFRERERIKRKGERWRRRLSQMPLAERAAIRAALDFLDDARGAPPRAPMLDRPAEKPKPQGELFNESTS